VGGRRALGRDPQPLGRPVQPSAIRGYEEALRLRLLPDLGGAKLSEVRRADVQALVDRLMADGHGASTIRNTLLPLRVIFRRALVRGEVAVNPTIGLELPAVRGRRDRIASPQEAAQLLAALDTHRAFWATAVYAGLRRGELQALVWSDVELDRGVMRVRASWDPVAGSVPPKTKAGTRVVPIASVLDVHLRELTDKTGGVGLVFGRGPDEPFAPVTVNRRAQRAWAAGRTCANRTARVPAHVRVVHDRRGGQCAGAERLHGACQRDDHLRPLRAPDAG
jgi:integrase